MTTAETAPRSRTRTTRRLPAAAWLAGTTVITAFVLPGHALASAANDYGADTPLRLDDVAGSASGQNDVGTSGGSIARVVVGLLVVVAAIYAVTWVLKQLKRSKGAPAGPGCEIASTTPLHGGNALQLVRVGDELLLLAVASGSVSELRRYTREEAEAAALWPEPDPQPGTDDEDGRGTADGGNPFALFDRTIRRTAAVSALGRGWTALLARLREMTVRR